jgi:hypothetical protein
VFCFAAKGVRVAISMAILQVSLLKTDTRENMISMKQKLTMNKR